MHTTLTAIENPADQAAEQHIEQDRLHERRRGRLHVAWQFQRDDASTPLVARPPSTTRQLGLHGIAVRYRQRRALMVGWWMS